MQDNFEICVEFLISPEIEGAYGDHPRDPGGATNWGITIGKLSEWRGHKVSKADVQALSKDEACAIYLQDYWRPVHGDVLPFGLDWIVFDCAVNQGESRARRWLQKALNVTADGVIGPKTLAAIAERGGELNTVREFSALRIAGYMNQRHLLDDFGYGWARRVALVTILASGMRLSEMGDVGKVIWKRTV